MTRRLIWIAIGACAVLALVIGSRSTTSSDFNTADARTRSLSKEIRCAECAGQSVAESSSRTAERQREEIRDRIAQGQTDSQIRGYFQSTYGEDIILRPSASGFSALVWALPVVILVFGIAGLAYVFRRGKILNLTDHPTDEETETVNIALAQRSKDRT